DVGKVQALIRSGASVTIADFKGETVMAIAARNEAGPELIQKLLDAGADPNIPDEDGVTPLMKAANRGDPDRVIALLSAGAVPKAKDKSGRTALDWAKERDDDRGRQVAAILQEAGR